MRRFSSWWGAAGRLRRPAGFRLNQELDLLSLLLALAGDTLHLRPPDRPVAFDGIVTREEYGAPSLELIRPSGVALIWLRRDDRFVYLAARLPDSSVYWADGLAVGLDTRGDRAAGPMHDDFHWDFRRVLDSSVVYRGEMGRWRAPRDDPDWRLGAEREGGGWEVRSVSGPDGWMLELRLDVAWFQQAQTGLPGLALLLFDDQGQDWMAWPASTARRHASAVLRHPSEWAAVELQ